jgi:predicted lipid-binding transport protein (Tim44 family)
MQRAFAALGGMILAVAICAGPVAAQSNASPAPDAAPPSGSPPTSLAPVAPPPAGKPPAPVEAPVDPSTIALPDLAFSPTSGDVADYDKYFYFHRADTDFSTAYADIQECDGYARGLPRRGVPYADTPYPYAGTMAGAVGGALGNLLVGAIVEAQQSAQRRRQRRSIMRTCMRFKDYQVFGTRKSLWEQFNFEEGSRVVPEAERQRLLRIQARVASGPMPTVGELRP